MEGNIAVGKVFQPNMPVVVNMRQDPFERYFGESQMYPRWAVDKLWIFVPAQAVVGQFLQSFKEYPPSQRSGSFSVDQVLDTLGTGAAGSGK